MTDTARDPFTRSNGRFAQLGELLSTHIEDPFVRCRIKMAIIDYGTDCAFETIDKMTAALRTPLPVVDGRE